MPLNTTLHIYRLVAFSPQGLHLIPSEPNAEFSQSIGSASTVFFVHFLFLLRLLSFLVFPFLLRFFFSLLSFLFFLLQLT